MSPDAARIRYATIMIAMLLIDWKLALLMYVFLPPLIWAVRFFAFTQRDDTSVGAGMRQPAPSSSASAGGTRLEFGRYEGWTLRDLARHDPDYLRWLSRHASGMQYRTQIYQILNQLGLSVA